MVDITPEEGSVLDADVPELLTEDKPLAVDIDFDWNEEEEECLAALKAAADSVLLKEFSKPISIMKNLQHKVRTQEDTASDGSIIWRRNADGSIYEDWGSLTLKDMDAFIMEASAWTYFGGFQVMDSYIDAVFAKFVMDEKYDSAYTAQTAGTVKAKTANANAAVLTDKYRAFFRNVYYKKAKGALDRLEDMVRRVERISAMHHKDLERGMYANRINNQ